ncbi:Glycosyltransferase involved in cell wall bisynthesis [Methanophagales archaeon]|nr:Glycosyltransferase involved in cell wall bisynthesis [Methanophagales archaeon]
MKHNENNLIVSVVISTYNRKELLKECIESLFDQTYPKDKYEIIIVDDGSIDKTKEMVKGLMKKSPCSLRYFKQENKGPATARNKGIKNAMGEIIAFTDDHCIADKDWLFHISSCFFRNSNISGVRGKVKLNSEGPLAEALTKYIYKSKGSFATNNIAYKKKVLEEIDGFDESFPLPASEDIDLGLRIINKGHIIKYEDKAIVWHPCETDWNTFKKRRILAGVGLYYLMKKNKNFFVLVGFYRLIYVPIYWKAIKSGKNYSQNVILTANLLYHFIGFSRSMIDPKWPIKYFKDYKCKTKY